MLGQFVGLGSEAHGAARGSALESLVDDCGEEERALCLKGVMVDGESFQSVEGDEQICRGGRLCLGDAQGLEREIDRFICEDKEELGGVEFLW